jgi:hypothetical protein
VSLWLNDIRFQLLGLAAQCRETASFDRTIPQLVNRVCMGQSIPSEFAPTSPAKYRIPRDAEWFSFNFLSRNLFFFSFFGLGTF